MAANSPRLGVLLMASAMAQKEIVFNEAIIAFDALFAGSVLSLAVTTPPGSPADGDCYVVPHTGATGAWAAYPDKLTFYYNGWQFLTIPEHFKVYNVADSAFHMYTTSGGWVAVATGTPTVLTDLTDVSVSGVVDGQVLKYDHATLKWIPYTLPAGISTLAALTDIDVTTAPTDGQLLHYVASETKWKPFTLPAAITTFSGLSDVDAPTEHDGWIATWSVSETKVKFVAPTTYTTIPALSSVGDVSYSGLAINSVLAWNGAVWAPSTTAIHFLFENMTDGPGSMVGATGKILRVNALETALEYMDPATAMVGVGLSALADVNVTEGAGIDNKVLAWNNATSKWIAMALPAWSLSALSDVTVTEGSGINNYALIWNNAASKWEATAMPAGTLATQTDVNVTEGAGIDGFTLNWQQSSGKWVAVAPVTWSTLPGAPTLITTLHGLTDVNVTEGAPIDGYVLKWDNATSKWIAAAETGGGGGSSTLAADTDVAITSPTNGEVLTYHAATSKWINAAPTGGGGGSGPITDGHAGHRAWRVLMLDTLEYPTLDGGGKCTMSEVAFYDRTGTLISTSGATLLPNYVHGSYPIANAFDGNTATIVSSVDNIGNTVGYGAGSLPMHMGLGVLWGTAKDVGSVKLTSASGYENHAPHDFLIQYSDDLGEEWTTFKSVTGETTWGTLEQRTYTLGTTGEAFTSLTGGGGGGSSTLAADTDVSIGALADGDLLRYSALAGKWLNVGDRAFGSRPPLSTLFSTSYICDRSGGTASTALVLTDLPARLMLHDATASGACGVNGMVRPIPTGFLPGNAFEFAARIAIPNGVPGCNVYSGAGLMFKDTASGKFFCASTFNGADNTRDLHIASGDASGGWNDVQQGPAILALEWLKVTYDASGNVKVWASNDGYSWVQVYTSTFSGLGGLSPTHYGLHLFRYVNGALDATVPFFFSSEFPAPY
jgi:hypothetical protein